MTSSAILALQRKKEMKTFLDYLLEQKKPAIKRKTIALVGGSYKPPHAGHLDMVQKYS